MNIDSPEIWDNGYIIYTIKTRLQPACVLRFCCTQKWAHVEGVSEDEAETQRRGGDDAVHGFGGRGVRLPERRKGHRGKKWLEKKREKFPRGFEYLQFEFKWSNKRSEPADRWKYLECLAEYFTVIT